ncbi:DUF4326 domain-containing protein [Nonomuraea sp. NPDC049400]|uniref:DUF4326 domain-containing protein n=1 Tax=Nonomuraea sp. NPDC049400 TaxID=3364352 RepID=UPI0037A33F95
MPRRVKVEGDRFHGRVPAGAVYVGREFPGHKRSPFANPHSLSPKGCRVCGGQVHVRSQVIPLYRAYLQEHPELVERARRELGGKDLACWCDPEQECHADALLDVVAGEAP